MIPFPSSVFTYKTVLGADPAANADCSDTVPTDKMWLLLGWAVSLVQGATQTPQLFLVIDDGTNNIWDGPGSSNVQAVNTTCRYSLAPGQAITAQVGAGAAVRANAPLPYPLMLKPGYRIRTVCTGLGANSDLGRPNIYVVEFGN